MDSWYSEIASFEFGVEKIPPGTGRYIVNALYADTIICIQVFTYRVSHISLFFIMLGHFTQVVWKASKLFGIAKAISSNGSIVIVANYDPPGNCSDKYVENVPSPLNDYEWL
mgnify:CR=1 FL=1